MKFIWPCRGNLKGVLRQFLYGVVRKKTSPLFRPVEGTEQVYLRPGLEQYLFMTIPTHETLASILAFVG